MAKSRITNATAVYVTMMLVFATGMWAILVFGSTLRAPPDLAGEWELLPEGNPAAEATRAIIEQSGRFVRLRLHGGPTIDLRMTEDVPLKPGAAASRTSIRMAGKNGASADFEATPASDVYRLTLDAPPEHRVFTARLVARTYARAAAAHGQSQQKH
jgi:hypothetical protein